MSSEFSTQTSTTTASLDEELELQPQVRILRHYRTPSASPTSAKRRAALTMPNGTRRSSPAAGSRAVVRGIVEVDLATSTAGIQSPSATSLPLPKTAKTTLNFTTTPVITTTTSKTTASLVVSQMSNNTRSSSTFGSSLDDRLPIDGLRQSSSTGIDRRTGLKIRKVGKSSTRAALKLDIAATEAMRGQRWRSRRKAVVGTATPLQTEQEGEQRLGRGRRCVGCLKSFVAFLVSTIGLTILLVGYTVVGGFIFRLIEGQHEVGHCVFIL